MIGIKTRRAVRQELKSVPQLVGNKVLFDHVSNEIIGAILPTKPGTKESERAGAKVWLSVYYATKSADASTKTTVSIYNRLGRLQDAEGF